MTRIFVSVGMSGRNTKDVLQDLDRAYDLLVDKFGFEDYDIVDNYDCIRPESEGRLRYLDEAIKLLGTCDICYFVKGWQNYKGCRVEMEVCKLYGIEVIEES